MTRLVHAWREMTPEQRLVAIAAVALLLTMFLPWYGLQSVNHRSGQIYSHDINAFGDLSFVEAAIFLVAAGVIAIVLARGDGREFQLPGGDGVIVLIAGCWAALLIFFRVFSRPPGGGEPVGIEWGFFLAFVAAGALAYAGWRMRAGERPEPPLTRGRHSRRRPAAAQPAAASPRAPERSAPAPPAPERAETERTVLAATPRPRRSAPVPARERPRYPPAPSEQLSFEDPPASSEQ